MIKVFLNSGYECNFPSELYEGSIVDGVLAIHDKIKDRWFYYSLNQIQEIRSDERLHPSFTISI